MSLYEQFHSDINTGFMFNIIKDEINKSLSIDISLDPNNYNDFLSFFNPIFDSNDVDEIEILNKDLLDKSIKFFTDKITPTDNLEKLLQQRESTLSTINESNEEYPYTLTENNWIGITHCHINDNRVEECNTYPDYDHSFKIENYVLVLNSFNNRVEKYTKGGIADPGESHYAWIHPDSVYVDTHTTR